MKRYMVLGVVMLYPNVVRFYPEAVSQGLFMLPVGSTLTAEGGVQITRLS